MAGKCDRLEKSNFKSKAAFKTTLVMASGLCKSDKQSERVPMDNTIQI